VAQGRRDGPNGSLELLAHRSSGVVTFDPGNPSGYREHGRVTVASRIGAHRIRGATGRSCRSPVSRTGSALSRSASNWADNATAGEVIGYRGGPMIEVLEGFGDNIAASACHGHVTKADYETVLIPDIEEKLKRHEKVRIYYEIVRISAASIRALCGRTPKLASATSGGGNVLRSSATSNGLITP
jgi:SpoIIAA-like